MSKNRKEKFEVQDNETIDACLDRIKKAGYYPIRRMEEPIFEEQIKDGRVHYEPIKRKIVFEAKLIE